MFSFPCCIVSLIFVLSLTDPLLHEKKKNYAITTLMPFVFSSLLLLLLPHSSSRPDFVALKVAEKIAENNNDACLIMVSMDAGLVSFPVP